jgi:SNF family Na+-dependent transporter
MIWTAKKKQKYFSDETNYKDRPLEQMMPTYFNLLQKQYMDKRKKYLIAVGIINVFIILLSLAGKGEVVDKMSHGIGQVIASFAIGFVCYPVVWLFNRKSEHRLVIAFTAGSVIGLLVAFSQIG